MATGLDRLDHPATLVLAGLCDDAAVFPPGNLPLAEAVRAHLGHRAARHGDLVGPLVVAQQDLPELATVTADLPVGSIDLALTVPSPAHVTPAVRDAREIGAVRLEVVEVAVPSGLHTSAVVPMLVEALGDGDRLTVYVEVPRDERRDELLAELAGTRFLAKFRTGGVRADLYPDEAELAGAIVSAVRHGVPFKATAGLHHAVRNTDPTTGFEQHGFLNLLAATDLALGGGEVEEVAAVLALRDGERLAELVRSGSGRAREAFRSFGTCSVSEPVTELAALGLVEPDLLRELP